MLSENTRTELELSQSEQFFGLFIKNIRNGNKVRLLWERQSQNWSICVKKTWDTENLHDCPKICVKKCRISRQRNRCIVLYLWPNPFWDSKPELFSDIACLRIPYQPCIVLFEKKIQVSPPWTGVNYTCTSMSCQPVLEYSKVNIFCCINM